MNDEYSCLHRLKIELTKNYFPSEVYRMHLRENNLDPDEIYDSTTMKKRLFRTVYSVLDSLSNNINTYMSIETEFTTIESAYENLEKRLKQLKNKLDAMPDDEDCGETYHSNVVSLFYNSMSKRGE